MKDEYNELLQFALVTPGWQSAGVPNKKPDCELRMAKPVPPNGSENDEVILDTDSHLVNFFLEKEKLNELRSSVYNEVCAMRSSDDGEEEIRNSESVIIEDLECHYGEMSANFKDFLDHSSMGRDKAILEKVNKIKENLIKKFMDLKKEHDDVNMKKIENLQTTIQKKESIIGTMENSLTRKDKVISKLMQTIERLKEKVDLSRAMNSWKQEIMDKKRAEFCEKIARNYHKRRLLSKAFQSWRNTVQCRWKKRMEKGCQSRADDTIKDLVKEYEEKLVQSKGQYGEFEREIERLRRERDRVTQAMQKAFMRGVCALNFEARSAFQEAGADDMQQQQVPPNKQYIAQHNDGVLPNNHHHQGSNNNDSQVRRPVITQTTSQQQLQQRHPPQRKKKQVTYEGGCYPQQQPRLARGLPSRSVTMKSKGDACRECPNKDVTPCQDTYTGMRTRPGAMTARHVQGTPMMPQPRPNSANNNPILVERHSCNVEQAKSGRTLIHVNEYSNATPKTVHTSKSKSACYTISRSLPK